MTSPPPRDAHQALVELFDQVPIVALCKAHWVEEEHALIRGLLRDDRFVENVDDVVVEFGSAMHQDVIDLYLSGDSIDPAALRRVWRDCVDGPVSHVFDSPVYATFFAAVRASRAARRSTGPRVLLGDHPTAPPLRASSNVTSISPAAYLRTSLGGAVAVFFWRAAATSRESRTWKAGV